MCSLCAGRSADATDSTRTGRSFPSQPVSPGRGGSSSRDIHRGFLDRSENPADSKIACFWIAFLSVTYLRLVIKPVNGRRSEVSACGLAGSRASLRSRECRAEIEPGPTMCKSVGGLGGRNARSKHRRRLIVSTVLTPRGSPPQTPPSQRGSRGTFSRGARRGSALGSRPIATHP
jgi:hypothetical protein